MQDFSLSVSNIAICIGSAVLSMAALYGAKIWYNYRYFKKNDIPTPPYSFFWGHYPELSKDIPYANVLREWTKRYGKTYGIFEGHLPVLITSDLEIIKEVFIRQASNFSARRKLPLQPNDNQPGPTLNEMAGEQWKTTHTMFNSAFSNHKLRETCVCVVESADKLVSLLQDTASTPVNVSNYTKPYFLEIALNGSFGLHANIQDHSCDTLLAKCDEFLKNDQDMRFLEYLGIYFHEFKQTFLNISTFIESISSLFGAEKTPERWMLDQAEEFLKERERQTSDRVDFLQLMVNQYNKEKSAKSPNLASIRRLAKTNIVTLLLAIYATTNKTLSICLYCLALYPDEQQKIFDEMESYFDENSEMDNENGRRLTMDNVQHLKYLEMFIRESQRIYPLIDIVLSRRCIKATTIKNIKCPVDLAIGVDVQTLHFDYELWGPEDPQKFYPLRFMPECKRNPLAWQAFGSGPRRCIGLKLADIELKITIAKIVQSFRIESTAQTPKNLTFRDGKGFAFVQKEPLILKFIKR